MRAAPRYPLDLTRTQPLSGDRFGVAIGGGRGTPAVGHVSGKMGWRAGDRRRGNGELSCLPLREPGSPLLWVYTLRPASLRIVLGGVELSAVQDGFGEIRALERRSGQVRAAEI